MKTKILRIMGLLVGIIASLIIEFFYQGGVLFMSILTILLIGSIVSYFKFPEKIKLFGNMSLAVARFFFRGGVKYDGWKFLRGRV